MCASAQNVSYTVVKSARSKLAELRYTSSHLHSLLILLIFCFLFTVQCSTIFLLASFQTITAFFHLSFVAVIGLCCFLPGLLEKGHRIKGNYSTSRNADIYQCLWFGTLNVPADNFPLIVGHCGAGRFCSEPQHPA